MDQDCYATASNSNTSTKRRIPEETKKDQKRKKLSDPIPSQDDTDYNQFISFRDDPILLEYHTERTAPASPTKTLDVFRYQDLAFEHMNHENIKWSPLFAHDIANAKNGAKTYVVGIYSSVFKRVCEIYSKVGSNFLLPGFYEIMVADRPCNLFLDLEFDTEPNQGVNGFTVLKNFVNDLAKFMKLLGILNGKDRTSDPILLYSPNPDKISFHVHIPGNNWIFQDHYHCGAFVRNFAMWTIRHYGSALDKHPYFFKEKGKTSYKFFADLAIYTNNRPFRLAYCAKGCGVNGKNPFLTISEWKSIENNPNELYKIKPNRINFLKSSPMWTATEGPFRIISMRNPDGSVPISTSYSKFYSNPGCTMYGSNMPFQKSGTAEEPIAQICQKIVDEHIKYEASTSFLSHDIEHNRVIIATRSKRCPIKEHYHGIAYHEHNHSHYVVYYLRGVIKYCCKDEDCAGKKTFKYSIPDHLQDEILNNIDIDDCQLNEGKLLESLYEIFDLAKISLTKK